MAAESGSVPTGASASWFLYMIECRDGSLYTGVTNDIERRVKEHNDGTASRYTRSRRPVRLRYLEPCESRSVALMRECAVRLLTPKEKRALIAERGIDAPPKQPPT